MTLECEDANSKLVDVVTVVDVDDEKLRCQACTRFLNVFIHRATYSKGLASFCKAETTFTFHFSILILSNAFFSIDSRGMKSESDFNLAMQWLASP